jgi:hypothetical protein
LRDNHRSFVVVVVIFIIQVGSFKTAKIMEDIFCIDVSWFAGWSLRSAKTFTLVRK